MMLTNNKFKFQKITIDEAYADYLNDVEGQIQNRISHLMIEKSNYESPAMAFEKLILYYESIQSKEISFEDAVSQFQRRSASKDSGGDLGYPQEMHFPKNLRMQSYQCSLIQLAQS